MAKASSKTRKTPGLQQLQANSAGKATQESSRFTGSFVARYTSLVGVHTTLLVFIALFLPRTTLLFDLATPFVNGAQQTSKDRPQHPFLVPLTQSPTSTLLCLCAGAVILQSWWGGWLRQWQHDVTFPMKSSRPDDPLEKREHAQQKLSQVVEAWIATFVSAVVLHAVFILFGAPLIQHSIRTFLLALLIAVLTIFPAAYTLGAPRWSNDVKTLPVRTTWIRLFAEASPKNPIERALAYPLLGAILGAWIGIIPIALDWDRPWQAWPLTPAYGAILGYITAGVSAVGTSLLRQLAEEHIRTSLAEKKAS